MKIPLIIYILIINIVLIQTSYSHNKNKYIFTKNELQEKVFLKLQETILEYSSTLSPSTELTNTLLSIYYIYCHLGYDSLENNILEQEAKELFIKKHLTHLLTDINIQHLNLLENFKKVITSKQSRKKTRLNSNKLSDDKTYLTSSQNLQPQASSSSSSSSPASTPNQIDPRLTLDYILNNNHNPDS